MAYPPIVPGVNVRNVRMALLVHFHVVLGRGPGLLSSCRGGSPRGRGSPRRSWTARRNVSTANRGMTATLWPATALPKSCYANENR
jgi:hypothetical protein